MRVGAATSEGLAVVASAGGTVSAVDEVLSPEGDNYGRVRLVDHGNGWETRYLHIETNLVPGAVVVRGQHLGIIGKYFAMTPHLHYTQLLNGTAVRVIGGLFNSGTVKCGFGAAARIVIGCELLNGSRQGRSRVLCQREADLFG